MFLKRWSKGTNDNVRSLLSDGVSFWDSQKSARCAALMELYRELSDLKSDSIEEFNDAREKVLQDIEESKVLTSRKRANGTNDSMHDCLGNLLRARTKGRGGASSSIASVRLKRVFKCSICKGIGHNKVTCPRRVRNRQTVDVDVFGMNETFEAKGDEGLLFGEYCTM